MLAALIIVFREVFEAGLIIGIVLAVTRSVPHRNQWVGGGVLAGVLAACTVAAFAGALSNLFAGMGQELFNAAILCVAAGTSSVVSSFAIIASQALPLRSTRVPAPIRSLWPRRSQLISGLLSR